MHEATRRVVEYARRFPKPAIALEDLRGMRARGAGAKVAGLAGSFDAELAGTGRSQTTMRRGTWRSARRRRPRAYLRVLV